MKTTKYSNFCLRIFGGFFSNYKKDSLEEKNLLLVKANISMSYEEYYSMATMNVFLTFVISFIFSITLNNMFQNQFTTFLMFILPLLATLTVALIYFYLPTSLTKKRARDTIAFVFSGHGGALDRTVQAICPWDSDPYVWDYDVFDYEIADILGETNAGNIFIFLDSCSSGGFIPEFQNNNPTGIMYVTTTCTSRGYGYDEPAYENGAWTYWFLDAGLIQELSDHIDMEGNFDWAYDNYTHKGKNDRPQEWDENLMELFYLW